MLMAYSVLFVKVNHFTKNCSTSSCEKWYVFIHCIMS